MHHLILQAQKPFLKKNIPDIKPGDTVRVHQKITETSGGKIKERVQIFEGLVIACKHGRGLDGSFTVRKIASARIGVERTFPLHSPAIVKIEKLKSAKVRRAKLYFLRELSGKKAKIKKELKEYAVFEEEAAEEELHKLEDEKVKEAELKEEEKKKEQEELEKKFEQAQAEHEKG